MEKQEETSEENFVPVDRKKKVGSYILGKTIGEGAFAKIRQGVHIIARERVAVKVVPKKALLLREYVRRNVRREAIVLQKLQHPNVIQMFEVMETENSYYLVLEYADCGDFIKYLSVKKSLPELECRKYVRQIVSVVDHMHRSNIVHRDLKLENFLLDKDMNIKLIDFGLSNVFYGDTSLSTQCGSPAYAAPEIFSNQKYGPGVDVWSVGVCMYAMLVGHLPFIPQPADNIAQLHALILKGCEIPTEFSEDCKDIMTRMMSVDSRKRIKINELLRHQWLLGENIEPVFRQPNLANLASPVPQATVINYMAKMFNFKESEILSAISERKVNAVGATYHLLQKRFDSGLQLYGMAMEISQHARRESAFSAFSIELQKRDSLSAHRNVHQNGEQTRLHTSQDSRPTSYRNYLQYLKENRERTNSFSKNIYLRRQKTRTITRAIKTENGNEYAPIDQEPNFRLTFSPNQTEVYEWETEGLIKKDNKRVRPSKLVEIQKERPKSPERHLPMMITGDKKISHAVFPQPTTPPNTSRGLRKTSQSTELESVLENKILPIHTIPVIPKPPSRQTLTPLSKTRYHSRPPSEAQTHLSEEPLDEEGEERAGISIVLADPCSEEIWGSFQKHKAKLIKGASLTISRTKTIYANPISSQKILTPRDYRPSLDDIQKAQIIGRGRLLIERAGRQNGEVSSDIANIRPSTTQTAESLPEVVSSAQSRSKSDLGESEKNSTIRLPDVIDPLPVEIPTTPPLDRPDSPESPVERIIVDDEAPMMRIRITSCSKNA